MHSWENRRYLTVKEASKDYFENLISVSALYNLIKLGSIKTIKLGHKILIPISELNKYCSISPKGDHREKKQTNNLCC